MPRLEGCMNRASRRLGKVSLNAGRAGDVGAWCGEGGLGDSVVLLQELELDDITVGDIRQPGYKS